MKCMKQGMQPIAVLFGISSKVSFSWVFVYHMTLDKKI